MNKSLIIVIAALWAILIACDIVFGRIMKLYDKTKWFDLTLHAYGGALSAATSFFVIKHFFVLPLLVSLFFAFCISLTASVFLEFIEFAIDKIFKTNGQRWKDGYNGGLMDTMTDLLAAAAGAVVICLVLFLVFFLGGFSV